MGGLLTSYRKDLTTRVQVTVRMHLLKLENRERFSIEEATGEPKLGCLSSLGSLRKGGPWEQVQGISLGQAASCPLP